MKRKCFLAWIFILIFLSPALAVEKAPRITDREIVERLTRLEEGQRRLEQKIEHETAKLNQKIEAVRKELKAEIAAVNQRIDDVNNRIEDVNNRIDDVNNRINDIKWMLGIFISVALVMLGFVIRMLFELQKRQSSMERELEKQRKEIDFLLDLVKKLLPEK